MNPPRSAFFISDRTGITAEMLGHSLLTQFEQIEFTETTLPFIDTVEKAQAAVVEIDAAGRRGVDAVGQRAGKRHDQKGGGLIEKAEDAEPGRVIMTEVTWGKEKILVSSDVGGPLTKETTDLIVGAKAHTTLDPRQGLQVRRNATTQRMERVAALQHRHDPARRVLPSLLHDHLRHPDIIGLDEAQHRHVILTMCIEARLK